MTEAPRPKLLPIGRQARVWRVILVAALVSSLVWAIAPTRYVNRQRPADLAGATFETRADGGPVLAWSIEGSNESGWSGAPPEAREALDRGLWPDDLPNREAIVSGLLAEGAMVRLDPGTRGRFDRLFGGRDLLLLEVLTGPQAGRRLLVPRGACERVDRR